VGLAITRLVAGAIAVTVKRLETHSNKWQTFCQVIALFSLAAIITAAEPPIRMAERARLDLVADSSIGELRDIRLTRGDGSAQHMNWVDKEKQSGTITADFTIWPLGWREFELQFTPGRSGTITLDLLGPYEQANQQTIKQEVLWDALQVDGAELKDGSFEQANDKDDQGWRNHGGSIVNATAQVPAADGNRYARTWHDARRSAVLRVEMNRSVSIRGYARAAFPADYVEMPRITSRDTAAHRALRSFRRGMNLGNYLEAPPKQDWGARYSTEDFDFIRQEGFDHVRLPIAWHHYCGPGPDYKLREEIFEKVNFFVREAGQRELSVIVNLHHFDAFTSNPQRERDRFLAIWRQIANRYAAANAGVAFELLNEPKDAATTELLNSIYAEAIDVIRTSNPTRTIFLGPGLWNSATELPKLRLPGKETNVIVTIHSYAPMNFTHQGASWTGPDFAVTGVQFPGPPDTPLTPPSLMKLRPHVTDWLSRYNTLAREENPSSERAFADYLDQARQWSEYYGRPIHLGEFGAIEKADAQSRANYCRTVRQQAEAAGMGWALWDWKAGFRYWNTAARQPTPGMREALFGK
jgi:endoglucanase